MIRITRSISIDDGEIEFDFVRSSGPGGQNVNKVATAAQLRFDVTATQSLSDEVKQRLTRLAGRRMTGDGVLIIDARRYRSQGKNRDDAMDRLVQLIRSAAIRPKKRKPTRPTRASKERRLKGKKQRSETKRLRGRVSEQ